MCKAAKRMIDYAVHAYLDADDDCADCPLAAIGRERKGLARTATPRVFAATAIYRFTFGTASLMI
jgi:hypothetical protein